MNPILDRPYGSFKEAFALAYPLYPNVFEPTDCLFLFKMKKKKKIPKLCNKLNGFGGKYNPIIDGNDIQNTMIRELDEELKLKEQDLVNLIRQGEIYDTELSNIIYVYKFSFPNAPQFDGIVVENEGPARFLPIDYHKHPKNSGMFLREDLPMLDKLLFSDEEFCIDLNAITNVVNQSDFPTRRLLNRR